MSYQAQQPLGVNNNDGTDRVSETPSEWGFIQRRAQQPQHEVASVVNEVSSSSSTKFDASSTALDEVPRISEMRPSSPATEHTEGSIDSEIGSDMESGSEDDDDDEVFSQVLQILFKPAADTVAVVAFGDGIATIPFEESTSPVTRFYLPLSQSSNHGSFNPDREGHGLFQGSAYHASQQNSSNCLCVDQEIWGLSNNSDAIVKKKHIINSAIKGSEGFSVHGWALGQQYQVGVVYSISQDYAGDSKSDTCKSIGTDSESHYDSGPGSSPSAEPTPSPHMVVSQHDLPQIIEDTGVAYLDTARDVYLQEDPNLDKVFTSTRMYLCHIAPQGVEFNPQNTATWERWRSMPRLSATIIAMPDDRGGNEQ